MRRPDPDGGTGGGSGGGPSGGGSAAADGPVGGGGQPVVGTWQLGEQRPLSNEHRQLVLDRQAASGSEAARLSEQLGEAGALEVLREIDPAIGLRYGTEADAAALRELVDAGQAWDAAIAYRGRNVTNIVYFDGDTMHIVEAKGNGGQYLDRKSNLLTDKRISQTHPKYPLDVAMDMMNSRVPDGRQVIGKVVREAYEMKYAQYIGVRTVSQGPTSSPGAAQVVIERLFTSPGSAT